MKKLPASSFAKGFTLIELLVVFSVIGILSSLGIASFVGYSHQQVLTQATLVLKNNLHLAQSKALSQEKPGSGCVELSGYELKFTSATAYTVSPVCSGFAIFPIMTVSLVSPVVKTAGPDSIRFKVVTGSVEGIGTITLGAYGVSQNIIITAVGSIK